MCQNAKKKNVHNANTHKKAKATQDPSSLFSVAKPLWIYKTS
jgi:hypothetical protein